MANGHAEQVRQVKTRGRIGESSPAQVRPMSRESGDTAAEAWIDAPIKVLVQAAIFGMAFGFLLQKGGVAKFDILVGVLLLENFVVVKVMLSAIVVGMIGVYFLERMGKVELQIKETTLGPNIMGGIVFGIGFGLIAYCPGTDAAAVGQGNGDALVGMAGMVAGSYLYALCSGYMSRTVAQWGRKGKITLADTVKRPRGLVVAVTAATLTIVLLLLELFAGH